MRSAHALPLLLLAAPLLGASALAPVTRAPAEAGRLPLPASTRAVLPLADTLLVATKEGLFTAGPPGSASLSPVIVAGDVTALARDASDGRILAAVDGVLLESVDGGDTFMPVREALPAGERPVALAAVGGRIIAGPAQGGVLVLDASGWRTIVEGLPAAIGAGRAAVVTALAAPLAAPDVLVGVTETARVIRSVDGGTAWETLDLGAGPPNAFRAGVARLADGGPLSPRTLFMARPVAVNSDVVHWALMRSDDLGASWRVAGKLDGLESQVAWVRASSTQQDRVDVGTADEILPVRTW